MKNLICLACREILKPKRVGDWHGRTVFIYECPKCWAVVSLERTNNNQWKHQIRAWNRKSAKLIR